jgi:hypothetical protein
VRYCQAWDGVPNREERVAGTRRGTHRLTQREGADALGVSVEAIRRRVKRGTLRSEKGPDGRRYVYLDDAPNARPTSEDASAIMVEEMRMRITFLERELERKDAILLRMAERIPELEAPAEPLSAPTGGEQGQGRGDVPPERQPPPQCPWWRRVLGE